jgi:hypothetical protein
MLNDSHVVNKRKEEKRKELTEFATVMCNLLQFDKKDK